ncbi:MAG: hypothetical protein JXA25_01840 [Anaerolineales bacterium]|nr:hypothetical protein [Anaerolineales bacterium]
MVLLGGIHPLLAVVLLVLYVMGNVFQARCCVGCPYRGGFCPPIFGVYLANIFSSWWYADQAFETRTFERSANIAMSFLGAALLFAFYWLYTLGWLYVLAVFLLMLLHTVLVLWLICPKCGYHDICPAGKFSCTLFTHSGSGDHEAGGG